MADYYPLIARAVAKLDRSTREARYLVYERARTACIAELHRQDPPVPDPEIEHERVALEVAIRRVEDELAAGEASEAKLSERVTPRTPLDDPARIAGTHIPSALLSKKGVSEDDLTRIRQVGESRTAAIPASPKAPTAPTSLQPLADNKRPASNPRPILSSMPTPETITVAPIAKSLLGFVIGFMMVFGLELMLFGGMEFLFGHRLRPVGAGWIVMPILAGCGGWKLFREIDFAKIARSISKRISAELGIQRREHRTALALIIAIGWIGGALLGFFVSLVGGPDYYPPTIGTWLFGRWDWSSYRGLSVRYFPWASLGWGIAGGIVASAVVYARQLLRSDVASPDRVGFERQNTEFELARAGSRGLCARRLPSSDPTLDTTGRSGQRGGAMLYRAPSL